MGAAAYAAAVGAVAAPVVAVAVVLVLAAGDYSSNRLSWIKQ